MADNLEQQSELYGGSEDASSVCDEERVRKLFQACDGDGDGYIDRYVRTFLFCSGVIVKFLGVNGNCFQLRFVYSFENYMLANVFRESKTICKFSPCIKYSVGMIQSFTAFILHPL
jgi:hypothetical protein